MIKLKNRKITCLKNALSSLLFFLAFLINACSEESELGSPIIEILDDHGAIGDKISIKGQNFGSDPSALEVKFNGVAATFALLSGKMIEAVVPEGARTGKVTIVRSGANTESSELFYVSSWRVLTPSLGSCPHEPRN